MVLYCAVHNDVAAQDVRGITRTFFSSYLLPFIFRFIIKGKMQKQK